MTKLNDHRTIASAATLGLADELRDWNVRHGLPNKPVAAHTNKKPAKPVRARRVTLGRTSDG